MYSIGGAAENSTDKNELTNIEDIKNSLTAYAITFDNGKTYESLGPTK